MPKTEDTPLMRQWREAKSRHPDALVFFRVGDFFELFNEDARDGSRLLGLTLTSRNNGAAAEVPMAGVPAKALDDYLGRLVKLGRRAAICDQVEDAADAKGIVRREVVETVTPGTVMQENLLQAKRNNFLVALGLPGRHRVGLAIVDLSTGELVLQAVALEALSAELGRIDPSELLLPRSLEDIASGGESGSGGTSLARELRAALGVEGPVARTLHTVRDDWVFDPAIGRDELLRRYRVHSLDGLGFQSDDELLLSSAGALVQYIREIRPSGSEHLQPPTIRRPGGEMVLDEMTRRNLELVEALRPGEEGGTLVAVIDRSVTSMGGRLLRQWLLRPLVSLERIRERQVAVSELVDDRALRERLRERLAGIHDVERLAAKVGGGRLAPRELVALGRSLALVPGLREEGETVGSPLLRSLTAELDPMEDVAALIREAIAPDAPQSLQEGGVIRSGFSAELDELREARDGAREFIAALQVRERERTGIGSLKVGFNRVFGYYLEVTKANISRVPDDYVRKQTLANAERYFTPELKEWEEKVTGAEERILALESDLFQDVRGRVAREVRRIQEVGRRVAVLDVLGTLAEVAERQGYVRPRLHEGFEIEIEAGRHPVVETMMPREEFIPNDLRLDDDGWIVVLTGPNMSGKSTILRQVGLIQLLAQMGSFVPAGSARLPVCDRIFTRVGASDNLARGQSTFMVEMNETAAIVHGATKRSLVLLDEIGRGTSTYDGVSIAWAVTEHLHEVIGARTIFATHYHELTQLGDLLAGVKNMNVAVREAGEEIVFLRRLEEGGADRSYGIQVARLAGLPPEVIARARELLAELEGTHSGGGRGLGTAGRHAPGSDAGRSQLSLFAQEDPLVVKLRSLDLEGTTPLEALNLLARLTAEARRGHDRMEDVDMTGESE
jgi:DNA mismatch repair protein MutS